ncbi:MAG: hypothetical protein C4547_16840 [Phycisphaerales bacterium]|nr:MAG: hypothetical protein C4547_16840 [Phycisphaerales bacterium]
MFKATVSGTLSFCLFTAVESAAETIRVPGDQPTIQAGIDAAGDGDLVLVSPGVYKETIRFNGKAITLRGRAGRDRTTINASGLSGPAVMCRDGEGPDTVFDGFTVTGGTGFRSQTGSECGGMYNAGSSPTVIDCAFVDNRVIETDRRWAVGGAMLNSGAGPMIVRCSFVENIALAKNKFCPGGAVFNENGATPTFIDCQFIRNRAGSGGAIANYWDASPTMINCMFVGNRAAGGAVWNLGRSSRTTIVNGLFLGNESSVHAGVLFNEDGEVTITSGTLIGNHGGSHYGSAILEYGGTVTLLNSIFRANGGDQAIYGRNVSISYSNVEGGWPGEGNIDADPLFVTGPLGDFYLSHVAAGQDEDSPCINAGLGRVRDYGLKKFTTRTDEVRDRRAVDMGYHFPRR